MRLLYLNNLLIHTYCLNLGLDQYCHVSLAKYIDFKNVIMYIHYHWNYKQYTIMLAIFYLNISYFAAELKIAHVIIYF